MDAVPLGEKMKGFVGIHWGMEEMVIFVSCTARVSEIDPFVVRHPQHEGLITELLAELIGFVTLQ